MGNCSSRTPLLAVKNPLPPPPPHEHANGKSAMNAASSSKEQDLDFALSPVPVSTKSSSEKNETQFCALGAGCYWGTEKFIARTFPKQSDLPAGKIISGQVGFMGPKSAPANPSYEDVCSGQTGHVEVYKFEFSGGEEFYEAVIRYFFTFHDPTTSNRQGNDTGTQYASVIFCYNQAQFDIATRIKNSVQVLLNSGALKGAYQSVRVTTDIRMTDNSSPFYPAHTEHQDYLSKNVNGYCNHKIRIDKWPIVK